MSGHPDSRLVPGEIHTQLILDEVRAERARQDRLWGQQDLPDGTGGEDRVTAADAAKALTDGAKEAGQLNYMLILREEFLEALAETDPEKLRAELIQVAAVTVKWIEGIDRRLAA